MRLIDADELLTHTERKTEKMNLITLRLPRCGKCYIEIDGMKFPVIIDHITRAVGEPDRFEGHVLYDVPHRSGKYPWGMNIPEIKKVIFNDPATIVIWADGTKTVVKTQNGEEYDPEKGLAMAITKKALGNKRDYYHTVKHWTKKYKKQCDEITTFDEFREKIEELQRSFKG